MKRATLIAGLTVISIGAAALSTAAFAEGNGHGKKGHGGPRFNFEEVDANADGKITQEEMQAHQAAEFAASDTDGDGKLSADELSAARDAKASDRQSKRQAKMMERMDTDGDGMLSPEEMVRPDHAKTFEDLDTDGDGALSEEELKAGHDGMRGKKGKDKK